MDEGADEACSDGPGPEGSGGVGADNEVPHRMTRCSPDAAVLVVAAVGTVVGIA